jgi:hypothetical protein
MTFEKETYFTVEEVINAAKEYVERQCGGQWPEDAWFDLGPRWSVDVWQEDGEEHITICPDRLDADGERTTDISAGIHIQ